MGRTDRRKNMSGTNGGTKMIGRGIRHAIDPSFLPLENVEFATTPATTVA